MVEPLGRRAKPGILGLRCGICTRSDDVGTPLAIEYHPSSLITTLSREVQPYQLM